MAKGFDNAYTKMVKALERLNDKFSEEFKSDNEGVVIETYPDGSGVVKAVDNNNRIGIDVMLFKFTGYEDLMSYLEAGDLKRTIMSMHSVNNK